VQTVREASQESTGQTVWGMYVSGRLVLLHRRAAGFWSCYRQLGSYPILVHSGLFSVRRRYRRDQRMQSESMRRVRCIHPHLHSDSRLRPAPLFQNREDLVNAFSRRIRSDFYIHGSDRGCIGVVVATSPQYTCEGLRACSVPPLHSIGKHGSIVPDRDRDGASTCHQSECESNHEHA